MGNTRTKPVAHRGYSYLAPENSIPAFEEAINAGFWAIECDIIRTTDGVWIMHHDETVDRMTDGTGLIPNMTYAQIQSLNIDTGPNIENYPNLKIPTFEESLLLMKKAGIIPLIDQKFFSNLNESMIEVVNIIRKFGMEGRVIFQTYNRPSARLMRSLSPKTPIMVIQTESSEEEVLELIDFTKNLGNNIGVNLTVKNSITPFVLEYAGNAGVPTLVFDVNNQQELDVYIDMGLDMVISGSLVWDWKY